MRSACRSFKHGAIGQGKPKTEFENQNSNSNFKIKMSLLRPSERLSHYEALDELRRQLREARKRLRESKAQVDALRVTLHWCGFGDAEIDAELERCDAGGSTNP